MRKTNIIPGVDIGDLLKRNSRREMDKSEVPSVIAQLLDMAEDRKSFFNDDGDDEVYREDYKALLIAIEILDARGNGSGGRSLKSKEKWKYRKLALINFFKSVYNTVNNKYINRRAH